MQKSKLNPWQQLDYGLLSIIFIMSLFSLIAVYSASQNMPEGALNFVYRQGVWYVIGFIALIATLFVDYRFLKKLSISFYIIGMLLLVAVHFYGVSRFGAQRWLEFGGNQLQPSEFVKIFLVIIIAHLLAYTIEKKPHSLFVDDLWLTTKIALLSIPPFVLILNQPDLGTALVLVAICAFMVLAAGIGWRVIFLVGLAGIGSLGSLIFLFFINVELFNKIIAEHQIERIYGWLDPQGSSMDLGYQLIQSMMAIGSGQLMGQGFTQGIQSQGRWVPEPHTDFIFAVIGEEFGFIGASILISFYFILIYRLVQIALSCNDPFGSYLIAGVIGMIVFQVFQNIGMTIGLMPITGLALPFISYGGSALLTNMIAMGIVLNVHMRTKVYMFD